MSYHWTQHKNSQVNPIVNIVDVQTLNYLEKSGYSFYEMLEGKSGLPIDNKSMYLKSQFYKNFADSIGKPIKHDQNTDQLPGLIPRNSGDIPEMVRLIRGFEDKGQRSDKDKMNGYHIRHLSNNASFPYQVEADGDEPRHFDYRWLHSKFGYFRLVSISNRMDKRDFNNRKSCGEVRFIYRLIYKTKETSSSLPFLVNNVREYKESKDCKKIAKYWTVSDKKALSVQSSQQPAVTFARHLKLAALKNLKFKQLELNFQSLRFTSGYMHDMGGQAMYLQRVYKKNNNRLVSIPLENTPNVSLVKKDPKLFKQFIKFLKNKSNLKKLDLGILDINFNADFLAKLSVSWSTHGRARLANKPYSEIFKGNEKELKSIDISDLEYIQSHEALVERLNNMTCMGCHQSGGAAGFHMMGNADPEYSHHFNRQELPFSVHSYAEVSRRKKYISALASGKKTNSFRPHSVFSLSDWLGDEVPEFNNLTVGSLCFLDKKHYKNSPTCGLHNGIRLECRETIKSKSNMVGECALPSVTSFENHFAGDICWEGHLKEEKSLENTMSYNLFAFQDKFTLSGLVHKNRSQKNSKLRYSCGTPKGGAPLGRKGRSCTIAEENFSPFSIMSKQRKVASHIPDEICANQGGNGFDMCAASGSAGQCLESRVARSMLDTCYPGKFCREDYVCQQIPEYHNISKLSYEKKRFNKRVNLSTPSEINMSQYKFLRDKRIGFCAPTYFLFNLRVDGHPSPVTGMSSKTPEVNRSKPLRGYTGLVDVSDYNSDIMVDMKYFSADNFLGKRVDGYDANKCLLTKAAAKALSSVQEELGAKGYALKVFDCYRPQKAVDQFMLWAKSPPKKDTKKLFYPEVKKSDIVKNGYIAPVSGHSRGGTVDLAIVRMSKKVTSSHQKPENCSEVEGNKHGYANMGTLFDCFSEKSHTMASGVSVEARKNRMLLKDTMEKHGFKNYHKEWWHFAFNKQTNKTYLNYNIR